MAKCIDCDVTLPAQKRGAPRKRCDECRLKRKRELQRGYRERPEVKARELEYRERPEVKAHKSAYNRRPEVQAHKREYQRAYRETPEGKARDRQYDQRPEVKARHRDYQRERNRRPEVKARNREYEREYTKRPEVKARRRLRMKLDRVLERVLRESRAPDDMRFRLAVKLIRGIADDPANVLARLRRTIVSGGEEG